jgi:hypothetical protein
MRRQLQFKKYTVAKSTLIRIKFTRAEFGGRILKIAQIREVPAGQLSDRSSCFGIVQVRTKNSSDQGHVHEIGQARSLQLDPEIGPVILDRSWADPKIIRNLLVGMSSH